MNPQPQKVQTTQHRQALDAGNTAKLGRDVRFTLVPGQPIALGRVHVIRCGGCGWEWNVLAAKENYFFTCPVCKVVGNLPGVFASMVDREIPVTDSMTKEEVEERNSRLNKIKDHFPPPAVPPPVVQPPRKQSS